ncbi:MAG: NADH-ubiquinone oxidoreductase-F iron-sulfur binding region domain-containing protein [Chloroflexota bacterium]|nr:NADH-ubiquinone oxidoreductase-F iron-sulfur binding region domain-containing protein [Chloroflexota bacterium]
MMQIYEPLKQHAIDLEQRMQDSSRIRVGTALCGIAAGASEVLETLIEEIGHRGADVLVSEVGCLGLCYAEPLVDIQLPGGPRVFYGNVSVDEIPELLESHITQGQPLWDRALAYTGDDALVSAPNLQDLTMMQGQVRVALRNAGHIDPADIYQYIASGGYAGLAKALSSMTPQEVQEAVAGSGLRGRGGAAFSTGTKWRFLMGSPGPTKYILCNCEEGDPGAFNDKGILESDPHTLVEGMILAGYATGASNGVVFIRHGHDGPIERTKKAIEDAYRLNFLGQSILGSEFSFDAEVSLVGESYVSGEETALMEAVEGHRAMPRFRPPFPAAYGVWGKPSNINNIKTLSYVPEIIAKGAEWFAGLGTERSKGTAILCLSGAIERPGLMEVPMGMTLRHALETLGGGVPGGRPIKLLQTGGPLGGVLGAEQLDVELDFDAMARAGAILGSGGIIVASDDTCAVDLTRLLITFCQFESCGKCFPCRLGMTHMTEILERICRFEGVPEDLDLIEKVGTTMAVGSLCGHGQLGFNPVRSALRFFGDEFKTHIEEKRCLAGVCSGEYLTPVRSRR